MSYKQPDIRAVVERFQRSNTPNDRYASFDYCYNYFRGRSRACLLKNMEMSCTTLGFFLASWGMLRGSSFLLEKSVKHYQPLIGYVAGLDDKFWDIDLDTMQRNIPKVLDVYEQVRGFVMVGNSQHLVLVTKVMLGIFGFIPAFDRNFCDAFRGIFGNSHGFRVVNEKSLLALCEFYDDNKAVIDSLSRTTFTRDFATGKKKVFHYPRAKILDMYGFTKGLAGKTK